MEDGDDKVTKTALNQMEDEDDGDDDNLLSQALLDHIQERAELEQEVTTDSDDDDDDGKKATAQFHLHFHFG